jgi:hypothetical protein
VRLRNIDWLILVWRYRFFPSLLNAITAVQGGDLQEAEAGQALALNLPYGRIDATN